MAVLSPNHHGRHLESDEDIAEFYRTAPIATPAYWDLADEVGRRDSDPEKIRIHRKSVEDALQQRAFPGRDDGVLRASAETMEQIIDSAIGSHE